MPRIKLRHSQRSVLAYVQQARRLVTAEEVGEAIYDQTSACSELIPASSLSKKEAWAVHVLESLVVKKYLVCKLKGEKRYYAASIGEE